MGGSGNAPDEVGVLVVAGVRIFGVVGLYMETGPMPVDRGAARSRTCGALPEGVVELVIDFNDGMGGRSEVGDES